MQETQTNQGRTHTSNSQTNHSVITSAHLYSPHVDVEVMHFSAGGDLTRCHVCLFFFPLQFVKCE